jgi:hypothetical protein
MGTSAPCSRQYFSTNCYSFSLNKHPGLILRLRVSSRRTFLYCNNEHLHNSTHLLICTQDGYCVSASPPATPPSVALVDTLNNLTRPCNMLPGWILRIHVSSHPIYSPAIMDTSAPSIHSRTLPSMSLYYSTFPLFSIPQWVGTSVSCSRPEHPIATIPPQTISNRTLHSASPLLVLLRLLAPTIPGSIGVIPRRFASGCTPPMQWMGTSDPSANPAHLLRKVSFPSNLGWTLRTRVSSRRITAPALFLQQLPLVSG